MWKASFLVFFRFIIHSGLHLKYRVLFCEFHVRREVTRSCVENVNRIIRESDIRCVKYRILIVTMNLEKNGGVRTAPFRDRRGFT